MKRKIIQCCLICVCVHGADGRVWYVCYLSKNLFVLLFLVCFCCVHFCALVVCLLWFLYASVCLVHFCKLRICLVSVFRVCCVCVACVLRVCCVSVTCVCVSVSVYVCEYVCVHVCVCVCACVSV